MATADELLAWELRHLRPAKRHEGNGQANPPEARPAGEPSSGGAGGLAPHSSQQRLRAPFRFQPIESGAFASGDYTPAWLVKRLLVASQPAIIGGPQKALKTSVAV